MAEANDANLNPTLVRAVLLGSLSENPLGTQGRYRPFGMFLPLVPPTPLVQIGTVDSSAAEFALAPGGYARYTDDSVFVAGRSLAGDWPYALPGPDDAWAGARVHEDEIDFGVAEVAASAHARLVLDLVGTQAQRPPRLEILLNGKPIATRALPGGTGDDPIEGHPERGRPVHAEFEFPTSSLQKGTNRLTIRNAAGSWAVFDALRIEADGVTGAPVLPGIRLEALPSVQAVLRTPAGPRQTLRLRATNLGPAAHHVFTVEGQAKPFDLKTGAQTLEFAIPPVKRRTTLIVRDDAGGRSSVVVAPVRPWTILLFPHAHVDVGYTDLQSEVERRHRQNLFDALQVARESASNPPESRYRYNIEASWVLDRFLRTASPAERAEVQEGLRRGDLAVTGGYANELTAAMRPEEMMQAYRESRRLEDEFGIRIDTASQTDVPGVSWGDVTALRQAKIDNLVLMPNGGDRIGGILGLTDHPFWWIGPSGRDRVFVWPLVTYGMAHGIRSFDGNRERIFRSADPTKRFIDGYLFPLLAQYVRQNYPYDLIGLPWSLTDNSPIDGDVPAAVKAWNAKYVYPEVRISTLSDGCREFKRRYGEKIPAKRGDLTPYWEDGTGSSAAETGMNRASADRLVQAATLDAIRDPRAYRPDAFLDAWRDVLLYTEHTWGAYNSISEPDSPFVKAQWATKQAFATDADVASKALLGPVVTGPEFDVVNTESWPRTDLVTLSVAQSATGDRVVDAAGKPLPSQRLRTGELAVLVPNVPAFGAVRLHCESGDAFVGGERVSATPAGLSGRNVSLQIDPNTGAIRSWRQDGREWVASGKTLDAVSYLLGTDLHKQQGPTYVRQEIVEPGPLVASVRSSASLPGTKGLTQEVRLVAGLGRLEVEDRLDKVAIRQKEAVHIGFPFDVPDGQVRIDTPWAVVRPEFDQLPGANKNWFCTQRFVDVSNDRYGVTLTSLDAPLVEVGGITANLLGSVELDEWRKRVEPTQTVYSWALNNHWHTNYRADQEGILRFRYALTPHGPYAGDVATRYGTEPSQPLLVCPASGPVSTPLLTLSDPRVIVTSLSPSADGKAFIVRLYGASGKDRWVTLRWRDGATGNTSLGNTSLSDVTQRIGRPLHGPVLAPGNGVVTLRVERLHP